MLSTIFDRIIPEVQTFVVVKFMMHNTESRNHDSLKLAWNKMLTVKGHSIMINEE